MLFLKIFNFYIIVTLIIASPINFISITLKKNINLLKKHSKKCHIKVLLI